MKALKYGGIAIVVIVAAVFIALMTVDVGQYKGVIEEQAKAATGREVKIGGVSLAISLVPAIVVSDIEFANAPWGSRPQMATIKRVEASAQLIPLLTGTVAISGLKVVDADVNLEINKDGKANWEFDVPPSESEGPALNVDGIDVDGLKLAYRDAVQGMSADVGLESAAVKIAGELTNLEITDVDLGKTTVAFKDKTQSLEASLAKLAMAARGPITNLGITALDAGDLAATYTPVGAAPIVAKFATAKIANNGEINLDGELDGQSVKAAGTLAPIADLVAMNRSFPAKLKIDALGISGTTDLTVDVSGKVPAVSGTVDLPEIDLSKFASAETAPAAPPAKSAKVFPSDPLPWDQLDAATADVALTVGKLTLPNGIHLDQVKVPVVLKGGNLTANGLAASLAGGTVSADLGMAKSSKSVSLKTQARGFTAENLTKQFGVTDLITNGDVDFDMNVRGSGDSVAAVMASLNGSVIGGMGESRIRNDALNMIGADVIMQLLSAINPFGNKDPYMVAKCAAVNFQITNGVANTEKGIAIETDKMEAVSTGKIDLAKEQIDLSIKPKATSGVSIGLGKLTQAVKLSGPLASPSVAVDAKGAVKALGSIGAAFATGGASLLAEGVKEKADTAGSDPCTTARNWHVAQK